MNIKNRWIIIGLIVIAVIIIGLLYYFYPLQKKAAETTSKTSSSASSTKSEAEQLPTGNILSEGEGVSDPEDDGVEWTENAVGLAVNKLPIIKKEYSLFYDYGEGAFLAKINAREGSSEANESVNNIEAWFKENNVNMGEVTVKYLYSE